jgi:hypothetical protein
MWLDVPFSCVAVDIALPQSPNKIMGWQFKPGHDHFHSLSNPFPTAF